MGPGEIPVTAYVHGLMEQAARRNLCQDAAMRHAILPTCLTPQ